jgi:glycosyltransferase involved in cell wall biosynthesis
LKILHLVSVADSQSIPLELALALKDRHPAIVIAAFRGTGDHPTDHAEGEVTCLDARGSFDLRAIWRLRALLVRHAPDIVHLHHAVSAFWTVLLALSLLRVPILVKTEHNDHRAQPWHQRAINVVLFPLYRAIVCNSDTTLNSFSPIEKRLAGTRARRIYNGLDLGRIRAMAQGRAPREGPIRIGHVGRLVEQKNQARLIEALARARRESGLDLRLDIVGNGPLLPELRQRARDAGVADAVVFRGALTRDAVYGCLADWDAFVMPSAFEGFCNALVEAMAAGLPVAVSDIDTLREVAGADALRFDHDDPAAIGAALVELAQRPRHSGAWADRYSMAETVAQHLALYGALYAGAEASGRRRPGVSMSEGGP